MFGHRNYSRYTFSTTPGEEQLNLSDAVKVNKLKDNQLGSYFHALKYSTSSKREFIKRNTHFEEFRKVINGDRLQNGDTQVIKSGTVREILKRYGVREVKEAQQKQSKPSMRRAPLKTIKTIGIEVPSIYNEEAIYTLPKKKSGEAFVQIAKPIKNPKSRVRISEIVEEVPVRPQRNVIEVQLQQTQNEIDIANTQLEQIRSMLTQRKSSLSPVKEEIEEMEEKANLVRELVDKKCSPMHPRTQWTVKSCNTDRTNKAKKNKLMSTLNNLNQRLQRIQEKYFNEPKMKYRSISDFIPPRSKETIQTLYKNTDYFPELPDGRDVRKNEECPNEMYDVETSDYLQQLIKRTEKLTEINKADKEKSKPKTGNSILVLMPPKCDTSIESDRIIMHEHVSQNAKRKSKKDTPLMDSAETVLEAPTLQHSICKSNYLMKEFNVDSSAKDLDLSTILAPKFGNSTDHLRRSVRFPKTDKVDSCLDGRLQSNIDLALKNSLFYHDVQD